MNNSILLLFTALFLFSCKDKTEDSKIDFGCFFLYDINGTGVGTFGACDGDKDWQNSSLNSEEKGWLNFADTIQINHNITKTLGNFQPIPNPINSTGFFSVFLGFTDPNKADLKVKLAFLNEDKELLATQAFRLSAVESSANFLIGLRSLGIPNRQQFRMYYQITGAQNRVLFEGYGDLLFCGELTIDDIQLDCF